MARLCTTLGEPRMSKTWTLCTVSSRTTGKIRISSPTPKSAVKLVCGRDLQRLSVLSSGISKVEKTGQVSKALSTRPKSPTVNLGRFLNLLRL